MSESLLDHAFDVCLDLELEDTFPQTDLKIGIETAELDYSDQATGQQAVPVRSITNSPKCEPASSFTPEFTPECTPEFKSEFKSELRPVRRVRSVRVDAWAVPASANWSRTRTPARKVNRVSRSTNWALPF